VVRKSSEIIAVLNPWLETCSGTDSSFASELQLVSTTVQKVSGAGGGRGLPKTRLSVVEGDISRAQPLVN